MPVNLYINVPGIRFHSDHILKSHILSGEGREESTVCFGMERSIHIYYTQAMAGESHRRTSKGRYSICLQSFKDFVVSFAYSGGSRASRLKFQGNNSGSVEGALLNSYRLSVKGTFLGIGEMAPPPIDGQLSVRKGFCGMCWDQVWRGGQFYQFR